MRQIDWKWFGALFVQEQPIRIFPQPSFRSPYLMGRLEHSALEPSRPVCGKIAGIRERTVLIRKNEDVIAEHNKKVADLLAVSVFAEPLVSVYVGPTPKPQERVSA